jgi:hypothetical protein
MTAGDSVHWGGSTDAGPLRYAVHLEPMDRHQLDLVLAWCRSSLGSHDQGWSMLVETIVLPVPWGGTGYQPTVRTTAEEDHVLVRLTWG